MYLVIGLSLFLCTVLHSSVTTTFGAFVEIPPSMARITSGNGGSFSPAISADGRFVAFTSIASDLVADDTNNAYDVFIYDHLTAQTTLVSGTSAGIPGDDDSTNPVISADGRYIAFVSDATNLVANDTNGQLDVFVYDQQTSQTIRVSVASNGVQGNAFSSFATISADGQHIAFVSAADNLVRDDTNQLWDIFVYHQGTRTTERVSISADAQQSDNNSAYPSISADGRYVVFASFATNLVPQQTNDVIQIFVRDRELGTTEIVSSGVDGAVGDNDSTETTISADGRFIAFRSVATNLVSNDSNGHQDIFVHDQETGQTELVSVSSTSVQSDRPSVFFDLSSDGRFVVFTSEATNLVPEDTNGAENVFLHDRLETTTDIISNLSINDPPALASSQPSVSADGRFIAFQSLLNLTPDDTNAVEDIFVYDRGGTEPEPEPELRVYLPFVKR